MSYDIFEILLIKKSRTIERLAIRNSPIFNFLCSVQGSAKRWKKFTDSECPEKEKFPGEWKNKNSLQRLCMMRALRPDRMTYAVT